eukprot:PhM_4_TR5859/c0_g1_i1/m.75401
MQRGVHIASADVFVDPDDDLNDEEHTHAHNPFCDLVRKAAGVYSFAQQQSQHVAALEAKIRLLESRSAEAINVSPPFSSNRTPGSSSSPPQQPAQWNFRTPVYAPMPTPKHPAGNGSSPAHAGDDVSVLGPWSGTTAEECVSLLIDHIVNVFASGGRGTSPSSGGGTATVRQIVVMCGESCPELAPQNVHAAMLYHGRAVLGPWLRVISLTEDMTLKEVRLALQDRQKGWPSPSRSGGRSGTGADVSVVVVLVPSECDMMPCPLANAGTSSDYSLVCLNCASVAAVSSYCALPKSVVAIDLLPTRKLPPRGQTSDGTSPQPSPNDSSEHSLSGFMDPLAATTGMMMWK